MEQNTSRIAILGVFLIALAAVIGLGFGIFTVAKGVSNEGVVNVQSNLEGVLDSTFDMYDNKVVTGNQVLGLFRDMNGKPISILVRTKSLGLGIGTYKGTDNGKLYIQRIGEEDYINYNAVISNGETNVKQIEAGNPVEGGIDDIFSVERGVIRISYGLMLDSNGRVVFNNRIEGLSKPGNAEYIGPNTKFDSQLIKDLSGLIIGVKLSQID